MRRVFIPLLVSTLLFAVSGCAFDEAQGDELDEVGAAADDRDLATADDRDLATGDDRDLDAVPSPDVEAPESLEGEQPPGGPTTNATYYDGCTEEHQHCRCQNTGWNGYCAWTDWWPEFIMRCYCG